MKFFSYNTERKMLPFVHRNNAMQANAMRKVVHPSCDGKNMLGYAKSLRQAVQSARSLFFFGDAFGPAKHGARILAQNLGEQLHGSERHILLT